MNTRRSTQEISEGKEPSRPVHFSPGNWIAFSGLMLTLTTTIVIGNRCAMDEKIEPVVQKIEAQATLQATVDKNQNEKIQAGAEESKAQQKVLIRMDKNLVRVGERVKAKNLDKPDEGDRHD